MKQFTLELLNATFAIYIVTKIVKYQIYFSQFVIETSFNEVGCLLLNIMKLMKDNM